MAHDGHGGGRAIPRVIAASAALVALLLAALLWFQREGELPPDTAYVPATLQDGRIVPAHGAAAMTEPPALTIEPPGFLSDPALASVLAALPEARIAGGAVRDTLAEARRSPTSTSPRRAPPDQVIAALTEAGIRAVPTGIDHGTVTAVSGGRGFEITTLRRDVETDGRHAVVAFTDDWRADAARRDFTMNALSMTRDGAVFDYFGGIARPARGRRRFVGDPATRIAEDYLRILRFFRFHARYASGPPDAAAVAAIRAGVPGLARLSAERVWSELARILAAPDPRGAVALMAELGVLAAVMPEGADPAAAGPRGGGGRTGRSRCCGWRRCSWAMRRRSRPACACPRPSASG